MPNFLNLGIHDNVSGARDMKNFVVIGLRVSITQISNFVVTNFFLVCAYFNKATVYTIERIFTQNTSNNVVSVNADTHSLFIDNFFAQKVKIICFYVFLEGSFRHILRGKPPPGVVVFKSYCLITRATLTDLALIWLYMQPGVHLSECNYLHWPYFCRQSIGPL